MTSERSTVLVLKTNGMGTTDEQPLREKLLKTYLNLVSQMRPLPKAVCFYTDGVKLACEGSPVLEELAELEEKGVRLILCQTCLGYFGLSEKVRVGIVGGMGDIITAMWEADSVLAP
jgi:intracellular sulfur oxidation DsrE/DsrF family protein